MNRLLDLLQDALRNCAFTLWNLGDTLIVIDPDSAITWRDHLGWLIHDVASWLFKLGYEGSRHELEDALEDIIPWEHMSARQREYVRSHTWSVERYRGGAL